jgi:hypothetical protein
MKTLSERLKRIKADFSSKAPAEALAIIDRATDDLRVSGIMSRIPEVGSQLPAFELPSSQGQLVRSDDLLAKGPLILSFYRGSW